MVRNRIVPLCGVIVALGVAGCAASPLYVRSNAHRSTVGEIPRDGNGEPMWDSIPNPVAQAPRPYVPPAPGIPVIGPGIAEQTVSQPAYVPPMPAPMPIAPERHAAAAPVVVAPPPAPGIPITGPGVAEMTPSPAYAPAAVYAPQSTAREAWSPLAPGTKAEIKQRKRDRHRACVHERRC